MRFHRTSAAPSVCQRERPGKFERAVEAVVVAPTQETRPAQLSANDAFGRTYLAARSPVTATLLLARMTLVTAQTLRAHGVPRSTAHRWVARAIDDGSWPTARVESRTKPALALVMPDDAYAALVASLAREVL